jgi:hypothetical protein
MGRPSIALLGRDASTVAPHCHAVLWRRQCPNARANGTSQKINLARVFAVRASENAVFVPSARANRDFGPFIEDHFFEG